VVNKWNILDKDKDKDVITKSENNIIKEALFAFLATIDRKI